MVLGALRYKQSGCPGEYEKGHPIGCLLSVKYMLTIDKVI